MKNHYMYAAKAIRVVNGNTLDLNVDLGFRTFSKQRVHLCGITPGMGAKDAIIMWLDDHKVGDEWNVLIESFDGRELGGRYGRWLAKVRPAVDTRSSTIMSLWLGDWLVEAGFAVRSEP